MKWNGIARGILLEFLKTNCTEKREMRNFKDYFMFLSFSLFFFLRWKIKIQTGNKFEFSFFPFGFYFWAKHVQGILMGIFFSKFNLTQAWIFFSFTQSKKLLLRSQSNNLSAVFTFVIHFSHSCSAKAKHLQMHFLLFNLKLVLLIYS